MSWVVKWTYSNFRASMQRGNVSEYLVSTSVNEHRERQRSDNVHAGPEVIKLFSCSTQPSMKLSLLKKYENANNSLQTRLFNIFPQIYHFHYHGNQSNIANWTKLILTQRTTQGKIL